MTKHSLGDFFNSSIKKKLGHTTSIPTHHYIKTEEALQKAASVWKNNKQLAIDTEFDDNNNYYGRHLCLIQLYDKNNTYLIDTIALKNQLQPLIEIFEDATIEKIFHSASSDLIVLDDVLKCRLKNIHDTSLMYRFLFKTSNDIGLQTLVEEKLGITLEKEAQISDWSVRPLSDKQVKYAITDVLYLYELFDLLQAELVSLGRWEWYEEERQKLEEINAEEEEFVVLRVASKYKLTAVELVMFSELFELRNKLAQQINRPNYKVVSNNRLAELIENPPQKIEEWQTLKGIAPIIRKNAKLFHQILHTDWSTRSHPIFDKLTEQRKEKDINFKKKMKLQRQLSEREILYDQLKEALADFEGMNLQPLILSNKFKNQILWYGAESVLNTWKMNVLEQLAQQKNLDLDSIRKEL